MGRMPADTPASGPGSPATPTYLADAVVEIERHVSGGGWDAPVRVFALVSTARALEVEPDLAERLGADVVLAAQADAGHLISVEQDSLPAADTLEDLLARCPGRTPSTVPPWWSSGWCSRRRRRRRCPPTRTRPSRT